MSKQPSTAIPLSLGHVLAGVRGIDAKGQIEKFESAFADYIGTKHAIAAGNGTTALYVALLAMKDIAPGKNEVVLPAYTVPTLTLAFNAVGLTTRLCDVDPETLNMSPESLDAVVTDRTLAVIPVHMFGFPCTMKEALQIGRERKIFVIEDACQAPGARLDGVRVGAIGDCGIFSFCKGKNVSTFHGGMVTTDNDTLAERIRAHVSGLPPRSFTYRASVPVLLTAFSFAMRPWVYGAFFSVIEKFKSTEVHEKFYPTVYNGFMAGVGNALMPHIDHWNSIRRANGMRITDSIEDAAGVFVPRAIEGAEPVFNHVPVVFEDEARLVDTQQRLFGRGIDTGRMYERPIHRIYDWLGYPAEPDPFPEATHIAPRILTLPSHPYLTGRDIETMIETVRG